MIVVQIHIGKNISGIRKECVDSVIEFAQKNNYDYKMFFEKTNKDFVNYIQSDLLRYLFACSNSDMLYCDTDLMLYGLPVFSEGKPYFAQYRECRFDSFLFYTNNCCSFFRDILEKAIKHEWKEDTKDINRNWVYRFLKRRRNDVNVIDSFYFKHYSLKGEA